MKKTIRDLDVKNKRVLVRCDFNVPLNEKGDITDDNRITAALPTIKYIMEKGGKPILMSHLGRPKGKADKKLTLAPVGKKLEELLGCEVVFADYDDVINEEVVELSKKDFEKILLLQNTRFRKEEKENEENFSKELAKLGDVFINDAFGTSHRAHASNVGVAKNLPNGVGFLVEKEIDKIGGVLKNPEKPLVAILGGAKVSDKINVIENLLNIADKIIIGGGMAFTFVAAQGYEVGKSILEEDKIDLAKELMKKAEEKRVDLVLPLDYKVAEEFSNDSEWKTVSYENIPSDYMGLDIGEKSIELFSKLIKEAKTVIWNGPMGVFEFDNFAEGTEEICKVLAENDIISIIGGGDSAAAVKKAGLEDSMTHISTGGGASLEFMEGKVLPGIDIISDK
ncbi:MAG TPA: phosphoglycerate kinase [Clostridiales bacterium]|nr:phosphoglycerate kinase [Clostridiales bacterium]